MITCFFVLHDLGAGLQSVDFHNSISFVFLASQQHALGDIAAQFRRLQVGYDDDGLADHLARGVAACQAGNDLPRLAFTAVHLHDQQLVGIRVLLAGDHLADLQIHPAEVIHGDFRFPGGGSNTVSRKYCTGVMSALVSQSAQKGLLYYDWNISSGDATTGGASAAAITRNVINGINKGYKTPIVLLHDAGAKYTTVQALEPILKQATEAGYTFAAMTNKTPTVHQKVLN